MITGYATSAVSSRGSINADIHNKNAILLKNIQFDTSGTMPASAGPNISIQHYQSDAERYYIVQFSGYIHEKWKKAVRDTGAILFDYVPNNAFIVRMNASVKAKLEALEFVQWVGVYQPSFRISLVLQTTVNNVENLTVLMFDTLDSSKIADEITQIGGEVLKNEGGIIRVRIDKSRISDIAFINGVSWIEKYVQPVILNDVASNITGAYTVRNTRGLNGSGQIIAVADTGLDTGINDATMHDDIEGRIVGLIDLSDNGAADIFSGHGTHVTGSVLGNGARSNGQFKGMAPNAQLVFQAVENADGSLNGIPSNLTILFQQAYDQGARIHTNSWGSSVYGAYTTDSKNLDLFIWEHRDMLILMAAGNDGIDANSNGVVDQDSIASPATAKNSLTVGASENNRPSFVTTYGSGWPSDFPANPIFGDKFADNIEGLAAFSSRGPTDDGRIKPDIVAPGTVIISTRSSVASGTLWGIYNSYYVYSGGTSMSTPLVAGMAALVMQYYMQNESITPSAALLKATIVNGAHNMTPGQYGTGLTREIQTRPDFAQGWGRADIENSLFPAAPRTMRYNDITSGLSTSQSWNVSYYVTNSSEPLRATLVWTDYPSATFVGQMLVNDLDLIVTGPSGSYLGNGGDSINNVEQVELTSPTVGVYTIRVNGTNIPQGPQPFALVISGALISDNTPPSASGEFPANNSFTNNNTTAVYVNLTDNGSGINLSSIEMAINGLPVIFTNAQINNGTRIQNQTAAAYNDGRINISVNSADNASNMLTYSWSFVVDTTPPLITAKHIDYPSGLNAARNGTSIILNISILDTLAGVKNATVNVSQINRSLGDVVLSYGNGFWTNSTVAVNASDGIYYLNITAYDNASNINNTQTIGVIVDNIVPQVMPIPLFYPNDQSAVKTGDIISLNARISDTGSGVKNTTINATSIGAGTVVLNNISGNWTNNIVTIGAGIATGSYQVAIVSYDNASNVNNTQTLTVLVDNDDPAVTSTSVIYPAGQTATKTGDVITLNTSITDAGSGMKNATINATSIGTGTVVLNNISGNWTNNSVTIGAGITTGSYQMAVVSYDNASNVNNSQTITVLVDNDDPAVPLTSVIYPAGQTAAKTGDVIMLNASIMDAGSGVRNATINATLIGAGTVILNNLSGNWTNSSVAINSGIATGSYSLNITAYDNASNINNTAQITVNVGFGVNLTVDSNAKSAYENANATFTVLIQNNGSATDTYNLTIDNPDGASASLNESVNITLVKNAIRSLLLNVSNSSSGTFRVNVTARSNNDSTKVGYINTTTTVSQVPTYIPPAPINLATFQGNFWINHTWQVGIAGNATNSFNVSVNGFWTNGTSSTYNNTTVGPHNWSNITVFAYNSSGTGNLNSTPVWNNTRQANNVPVQQTIANQNVDEGIYLVFNANATDADSDILIYDTNATKGSFNTASGQFAWTPDYDDSGINIWYFNSTDGHGGVNNTTITVIVNNVPLSITSSTPAGDPPILNGTAQIFEVNYNRSVNVTWYLNGSSVQQNLSVTRATYTNTSAGAGVYNVTAVAGDGYDSVLHMWNWTVFGPIGILNVNPADNSNTTNRYVNVTVTLDRAGNATLAWDGGANESMEGSGTSRYKNKTNLLSGNYTFMIFINDSLGSTNSTGTRTVIVNLTNITPLPVNQSTGNVSNDVIIISPSGNVTVTIFNGTNTSVNGTTIANITIDSPRTISYALAGVDRFIGENLTLGPDGAVFNPATRLNFSYNGSQLGTIPASRLKIKFYNIETGSWDDLTTTVITDSRIATTTTTHFSTFALTGSPEPASNPPSSGGSGGGGGGGGGGGTSGENFTNIIVKEKHDMHIFKDRVASYAFSNKSSPILFVNITGNVNAGEINTAVEVLKNTSTLVKNHAPGIVYKNANIWVGTSGFAVAKNIKSAEISFRVEMEWMDKVKVGSISLYRYDSEWIKLATKRTMEDNEFSYYEASTEKFSPFAIAGEEPKTGDSVIVETPHEINVTPTETVNETAKETSDKKSSPGINTRFIFLLSAAILIVIITILLVKMKRRK